MAEAATYYRQMLRITLRVRVDLRNELLYILAMRHPLEVPIAKAVWRYFTRMHSLRDKHPCPPVGMVARWASTVE